MTTIIRSDCGKIAHIIHEDGREETLYPRRKVTPQQESRGPLRVMPEEMEGETPITRLIESNLAHTHTR